MRTFVRIIHLALTLCLIPVLARAQQPTTENVSQGFSSGVKRILVLHSYNYSQPAQQLISAGLESARKIAGLPPEDFQQEYLDISPPKYPEQRLQLSRLLLSKYGDQRYDLIITVFDKALGFLLDEGKELSPDSPCLALYGQERPGLERGGRKVVQSPLYSDARGTLELALQLFPKTRKVLFVSGTDSLDRALEKKAQTDFIPWQGVVDFEYTSDRSVNEVLERVSHLPPESLVLYSRVSADITGKIHSPGKIAENLAKSSSAPVFCLATSHLDKGVVGGSMVDVEALSAMLGRLLPTLNTREPITIEPPSHFVRPMLNWDQILRWKVDTGLIPANSLIINRPLTLWSQYQGHVMAAGLALVILLFLLIILAVQSRRRRTAETAARLSEARFRMLIEHAPDAIVVYEAEQNRIVEANVRAEELFGCSRDELRQSDLFQFYSPEQPDKRPIAESANEHFSQATTEDALQFERRIVNRDGIETICEVRLRRLPSKEGRLFRFSFIDITERKRAEELLRLSEEQYRSILAVAMDGFWLLDTDGHILEVNEAFCRMNGYSETELKSMCIADLEVVETPEETASRIQFIMVHGWVRFESRHRHKDGHLFDVEISVSYRNSCDGQLIAFIRDITERKQAEQALADEAVRRRILIDKSRDGIVVIDQDGKVYEANLRSAEMLGYTPEEMLQLHVWDWDTQYSRGQIVDMIRSIDATGDMFETRHRRKDGSILDVEISTNGVVYGGQKLIFCVCRDITERKKAEERLLKSEQRFRSLLDQAADDITVHDLNGQVVDVNQQACRSLGYSKQELLAMNVSEVDPDLIASDKPQLWKAIAAGERFMFETRVRRKDGSIYPVEASLGPIEIEDEILVLGIARNITERKQAEQELRDSEARFKALHNASFGGIAIHDKEIILECNQGLSEISGYSVTELIGMDGLLLIALQSRNTVMQNILTGYEKPYEVMGLRKDGTEFPVRLEARNIPYKGTLVRSTEFRDITELKRGEEEREMLRAQLNQAQKLESVGRLAGGVAHDFNNMLSVILGHAELALEEMEPSHFLLSDLTEIKNAAERSANLTRQLLAFARRQTISPKILDLNETVEGMLKMLRRLIGEDIDLAWLPAKGLWPVKVDPSQIDQILVNLCVNARDAIPGVGKVTIETGNTVFDNDYCACHAEFVAGEFVMLVISDDGCGMDKETQERIFEPFYTTKSLGEGTGLGLSTVYGIVKQNQGFINVYSEVGQGTTFKIYLPSHTGDELKARYSEPGDIPKGSGETVLVVEDDPAMLEMTRRMLEKLGYTSLTAGSPGEAMQLIHAHPGAIRLLMTDVVMPEINGRELASRILQSRPSTRCLFMSGYTANVIAHHGVLEEGVHFIQKPFSIKDLAFKIRETLEAP